MKQTKRLVQATQSLAIILLLLVPVLEIHTAYAANQIPITGITVPGMESFDRIVTDLMVKWQIPGGQVAVTKDGRLVFVHGYGQADVDRKQLVQPDSLFRIASLSKPITAVTVLKLVEEGRLDLDAKVFQILDYLKPPTGASVDPRMWDITIRELLQHSGGWDRTKSFDPMFVPTTAAEAVGVQAPANCETVIRYMLGQRLDFDPGTKYAYSNFGYCILGRIVEKVTGQKYEDYVRANVLGPMGITDMRIGHTQLKDRAENEVQYYDYPAAELVQSVFPDVQGLVPRPYGDFYLEAMDSHGGWIASAIDLVRFAVSIEGERPPAFLKPETIRLMTSRPAPPLWVGEPYWYGMGWLVRPIEGTAANWWHDGSLPGTRTILVRTSHGLTWAALFNARPPEDTDAEFLGELDDSLWEAANAVTAWPTNDLFAATTRYEFLDSTMCRNVDTAQASCVDETHAFDANDERAFVYFRVRMDEAGSFSAGSSTWYYQSDSVEYSHTWDTTEVKKGETWAFWDSIDVGDRFSGKRGFWRVEVSGPEGGYAFTERFTIGPFYQVQVKLAGVAENVSVPLKVDGESYGQVEGGEVKYLGFAPGTSHELSVQSEISSNVGVRWTTQEDTWRSDGVSTHSFTYEEQYQLSIEEDPIGAVTVAGADWYSKGSTVDIGPVPVTVNVTTGTRLVMAPMLIDNDFENAVPSLTITMYEPHVVKVQYRKQYYLRVASEYGPLGEGWYDEGASATFSATSPVRAEGLMGMLGAQYVFDHWSGDSNAATASASVTMDGPKTVTAQWRTDNTMPYILIGVVVVTAIVDVALLRFRKRRKAPRPLPSRPMKYCIHCGSPISERAQFCEKCGAQQ